MSLVNYETGEVIESGTDLPRSRSSTPERAGKKLPGWWRSEAA